jgi:hypothetical protein
MELLERFEAAVIATGSTVIATGSTVIATGSTVIGIGGGLGKTCR